MASVDVVVTIKDTKSYQLLLNIAHAGCEVVRIARKEQRLAAGVPFPNEALRKLEHGVFDLYLELKR